MYVSSRYQPFDSSESHRESHRESRDRSPGSTRYNDSRNFGQSANSSYRASDGQQQRSGSDSRVTPNSFAAERESFRDRSDRDVGRDSSGREPPSGPKAFRDASSRPLLCAPSGPRGSNAPGDFRGRGATRGRGWRDNSRDRGRDADYRDREEKGGAHARSDRGREWGRSDRDWPERDRIYRDNISFRDRRPSSPGNSRSPARRGSREVPLSLDVDRTRKGSRDGPLSASSQSDQSAGPSAGLGRSYSRAPSRGRGDWDSRGRGEWDLRGRGEWESRGRGRGAFFDDRGRRGRSRSPEAPQRRAFTSRSPSTQAPEVPAFGTPIDSNPQESFGTAINIPTAPRSHKPINKGIKFGSQHSHPVPTSVKWIRPEQAPPTQETLTTEKPVEPTATDFPGERPEWAGADQKKKNLESEIQEYIPIEIDSEEDNSDSEDENSDSDSADEMVDYLKALQKPQDRPAQTTLDDIRGISNAIAHSCLDSTLLVEIINTIFFEVISEVVDEERKPPTPKASPAPEVATPTPTQVTRPKFVIPEDTEETDVELDEELQAVRQKQLEAVPEEQLQPVRRYILTPPLDNLPNWGGRPWHESEGLSEDMDHASSFLKEHAKVMIKEAREEKDNMVELKRQYKEHYKQYLIFCDSDDPAAVNYRKRLEASANAKRAESVTPAVEGRAEGRRAASRFATEHDMERVLKESEREARETQEKNDKAANAKAASEKEAAIPNMLSIRDRQRPIFEDTSHLVPFERSLAVLEFGPPQDNFTADECRIFEEKYLEFPKDFRTISSFLPGRDTKNCIQHYYLVKHRDDLKGKLKTRERGRKRGRNPGGSKPKSNALIASLGSRGGETEDTQDAEGNGERRRLRRAAAPTWPRETAASESETATPAPTPSRKTAGTQKADNSSDAAAGKRKGKPNSSRDKSKQPKNSQPLAAAPTGIKAREEESSPLPVQVNEWQRPRGLSDPSHVPNPWDAPQIQPSFPSIRPVHDVASVSGSLDVPPQVYNSQDRIGPLPPSVGLNAQQEQRNNAQTSSYWSVTEQNDFPALLRSYGTDWVAIAKYMGTKTHVMVKNYYQRQVDSGKNDLEEIAKASDEKRKRGESTAPPPPPTMPIKQRRFDVPAGTLQRPLNPGVDSLDEINSTGQIMVHTPSPQGPQSIRFPGHAQAAAPPAQVVQTSHPAPIASEQIQHPQGQQIVPPGRAPRGPTLGFFNTVRPILQAATPQHQQSSVAPDATRAQRTIITAHETQLEVQQALRKEQQMRDQQSRDQQLREQQLREQKLREQQLRDQQLRDQQLREQQLREQQLREQQREQQLREQQHREQQHREQQHREQQLREQQLREQQLREQQLRDQQIRDQQLREQQIREQQIRDKQIREQQLRDKQLREQQLREQQVRDQQIRDQQVRDQQAREQQIREMAAREQLREQQAREQQNRDQQARQQHIRPKQEMEIPPLSQYEKYSAPSQQSTASQPREGPPIYGSEVRHPMSAQYGPRTIPNLRKVGNDAASSGSTALPNVPQNISRNSMNGPSINQELPATSRPQAPSVAPVRQQETVRKTSNIMSLLNEEPSELRLVQKREVPQAIQPSASPAPQGLYQPNRPLTGTQPPPIRRETPLGDIHTVQNYPRSTSSSQGPIRVVESPYPVVAQSQSQQSRSHAGSPMEPTSTTEFEYYAHQQPYGAHSQQQTPVDSPRLGPAFHNQPQHPHRTMAFGASTQRTASPPSQYAPSHPVRHENFDGRFPIPLHSRYNSSGSVTPSPYPPTTQLQHPMSAVRLTSSQSSAPQVQLTSQMPPQPTQPLQPQPQQHQQQASSHSYAPLPTHPNMQHHIQSGTARSFSPPRLPTYDSRGYAEQQGQQQQQQQAPTAIMRRQLLQTPQQPQHLLPHQQREQRE